MSKFFDQDFYPVDPAIITESPNDIYVKAGGIAALRCVATGDPTPTISWLRNGHRLEDGQSRIQIYDFPGGSVLRIEPVRKKRDDYTFKCVARNNVGEPAISEAKIKVLDG